MDRISQAMSYGDIRIDGQGNSFTINQVIQISVAEVKTRNFVASSPYRGLLAFNADNKDYFYGRDQLVAQLVKQVMQRNLVLLAGASGSGKSSVVRAGLLPALTERLHQGLFRAFTVIPDRDPFESLRMVLRYDLNKAGWPETELDVLDALNARTADSLVTTLASPRPPRELWLLFIDQFEQIFTRCADVKRREEFLVGLARLAADEQREIKIVLAMRADFFDHFGPHPEFGVLAQQGIVLALNMHASELRAAIEQPAARHGVIYETGLVEQIIADVQGRPGALPLLQYALDLLWHEDNPENDRTLNRTSYHQIEGIEGALKKRADEIYTFASVNRRIERSVDQREAMRRIFLSVVDLLSPGADARAISRRASLDAFPSAEDRRIIGELVDAKLLVSNARERDEKGQPRGGATIEFAHEALLSAWPKLKEWIDQAREVIYVRNRLAADARHYVELAGKQSATAVDDLWRGSRLQQALDLRNRGEFHAVLGGLSTEEEAFLSASEARREQLEREAEEQLKREREAAEKIRQLLLDSYIERGHQLLFEKSDPYPAALWLHRAYRAGSKNPALTHLLKSAMLSIDATKVVFNGHESSVQSASFSPEGGRIVTASYDGTARVWDARDGRLVAELKGHEGFVHSATFSPEGERIVTASGDGTAQVCDARNGRLIAKLKGHGASVQSASFSPEGGRIVTASYDGTARVWDAGDGRLVAELKGHGGPVQSASFSPEGGRIVTASYDGTARVWDAEDGRLVVELKGHEGPVQSASFSPEGGRIVTASYDGTARVWDAGDGRLVAELKGHGGPILSTSFSPEGGRIVTASGDGTARIWDARDGRLIAELKGHGALVQSASFSPEGGRIVTASGDGTARVWDAGDGRLVAEFKGHGGPIQSASFSPEGGRIVTASGDGTARVWDARDGRLVAELKGHGGPVQSASFSPKGRHIVTASEDGTARVWDAENGRLVAELKGHGDWVQSASFSPEGGRIVTASRDGTARVWDVGDGRLVAELKGHGDWVQSASFSPEGGRIVTASGDGTARVWDAGDGRLVAELKDQGGRVESARFSPEGGRIVTAGYGMAGVWDAEDGRLVAALEGHWGPVLSASFSPKGGRIVTASGDETARVWDAGDGRLIAELKGHGGFVRSASFSPEGGRIVTANGDGMARVWDAGDGRLVAELKGHGGAVQSASFSPEGERIVTASEDGTARVWDLTSETRTPEQLAQIIRQRSWVRFDSEDSNILVRCTSLPAES